MLALAVMITSVTIISSTMIRSVTLTQTEKHLHQSANVVHSLLEKSIAQDFDDFCKNAGTDLVRVTVINFDGEVLGDSHTRISDLDNHAQRPEIKIAYNGLAGFSTRYSDSLRQQMMYIALPVTELWGQKVVLRLSSSIDDVLGGLKKIHTRLATSALLIFFVVSTLVYLTERRLIGPIPELQKAAQAYSRGELDHYLRIDSPSDLRQVAGSLNLMATSLKGQIAQVTSQKNELRAVFAGMNESVMVLDTDLKIRDLNPSASKLLESSLEDAKGRSLLEMFRNSELYEFASGISNYSSNSKSGKSGFIIHTNKDIHLEVHGAPLPADTESGIEGGVVLVLHDITQLKKLEEVRKDFVANVSHELKTPITSIKGYVETLLDGAIGDPDNAREFLQRVSRHSDRLIAILDDLLSLANLEQENATIEQEECDIALILKRSIQNCQVKSKKKGIQIILDTRPVDMLRGNPLLIEQAITNLIDNAVKYSSDNSRIQIKLGSDRRNINVTIQDQGIGIPREDLPRIFERFYTVDKARSRDLGGTGLGLAIVKHITMIHGGTVEAESELGRGSIFTFHLPINRAEEQQRS